MTSHLQDDRKAWVNWINEELQKSPGGAQQLAPTEYQTITQNALVVGVERAVGEFVSERLNQDDPRNDDMARLTTHLT